MPSSFTLDGKAVNAKAFGSQTEAVLRYLDKLPSGTLLSTRELCNALGCSPGFVKRIEKFKGNVTRYGCSFVWGSRATIVRLEKEIANHD